MIGRLVEERMPRSSSEYIIRKAAESSLLGLTQTLSRSPLAEEIERRGEAAYRPSKIEKGAAKVLGVSADAVMLGGAGSWTALARFVGMDAAVSAVASRLWPEGPEPLSAEPVYQQGRLRQRRQRIRGIPPGGRRYTGGGKRARGRSQRAVAKQDTGGKLRPRGLEEAGRGVPALAGHAKRRGARTRGAIQGRAAGGRPGQEEAYLQDKARREAAEDGEQHRETGGKEEVWKEGTGEKEGKEEEKDDALREGTALSGEQTREERDGEEAVPAQGNANGWEGVLGTLGLDGMGDVAGNLGYVIAMLPDILLGTFTGKTQSLRLGDNLLPIASIVAGMFIRNPLLKMLLIGLGGANLLNKAGHEALEKKTNGGKQKHGHDRQRGKIQTLRGRTARPAHCEPGAARQHARGHDRPRALHHTPVAGRGGRLPHGALPLNTLANAVLAQSDRLRAAASRNYDNGQQETLVRTRGIQ